MTLTCELVRDFSPVNVTIKHEALIDYAQFSSYRARADRQTHIHTDAEIRSDILFTTKIINKSNIKQ